MKTFFKYTFAALALLLIENQTTKAENDFSFSKFKHKIIVGYNIGGSLPIPFPEEIRSIDSYWPQFTPHLGYNVSYPLTDKWNVESGILLDLKGMGVRNKVKYMYTNVTMDGSNLQGYFTGRNETKTKATYITVPLRLSYNLTDTWRLRAGGYASYRTSSEFSGTVWDGYIRVTTDHNIINSDIIEIPDKDVATFDFGKDLRTFDFGASVGFEHDFKGRFGIYGDVTYSITKLFPKDFTAIDVKMHNFYISIGASYRL